MLSSSSQIEMAIKVFTELRWSRDQRHFLAKSVGWYPDLKVQTLTTRDPDLTRLCRAVARWANMGKSPAGVCLFVCFF